MTIVSNFTTKWQQVIYIKEIHYVQRRKNLEIKFSDGPGQPGGGGARNRWISARGASGRARVGRHGHTSRPDLWTEFITVIYWNWGKVWHIFSGESWHSGGMMRYTILCDIYLAAIRNPPRYISRALSVNREATNNPVFCSFSFTTVVLSIGRGARVRSTVLAEDTTLVWHLTDPVKTMT